VWEDTSIVPELKGDKKCPPTGVGVVFGMVWRGGPGKPTSTVQGGLMTGREKRKK